MPSTTTTPAEQVCRAFAAQYPTPNVLDAIRHAESGRLTWEAIEGLFTRSLAAGLTAVR